MMRLKSRGQWTQIDFSRQDDPLIAFQAMYMFSYHFKIDLNNVSCLIFARMLTMVACRYFQTIDTGNSLETEMDIRVHALNCL